MSNIIASKDEHYVWPEKYRTTNVDEYIGNDEFKAELKKIISTGELTHLMLHGESAGTGKTTAAKLIVKNIDCDYIYINASDENNIDTVRTKIKSFASTTGFSNIKVVILDESCRLTPAAQDALKSIIETFSLHTRFIFTCNYIEKIIPQILSRCQVFEILPPSKKEIALFLKKILDNEGLKYITDDLVYIVNTHYPDIRKMLVLAQQSVKGGEIKIYKSDSLVPEFKNKMIEMLKKYNSPSTFNEIRQLIADNNTRCYEGLYQELYDKVDVYASDRQSLIILTIAEYMYQSNLVVNKEITFMACISKILTELKK